MEMFLKALLKSRPDLPINETVAKVIVRSVLFSPTIFKPLAAFYLDCGTQVLREHNKMYRDARLFMAYDGALDGGRDQDWWFDLCVSRFAESAEYWSGSIPNRVSYCMAMEQPLEYPNAYVRWTMIRNLVKATAWLKEYGPYVAAGILAGALL